jgi:pimeloyl-ACP methyl ester carboxylesterase
MKLRCETISIPLGRQHLDGTLLVPEDRRRSIPGVLFAHGWGGNKNQYLSRARIIAALGCVCLTFDLRGHERTQPQHETVTRADNLGDVLAAYDLLAGCGAADRSKMAIVGSSYGAYLAAIATSLRPVRWLALRAPALYKDADWHLPKRRLHDDPDFESYRQRAHPPQHNRALAACARFKGDGLVVESQRDSVMPHPVVANYVAALSSARSLTYRVIEEADHGLSQEAWKNAYTDLLVTWLKEMTANARGTRPEQPQAVAAAAASLPEES